ILQVDAGEDAAVEAVGMSVVHDEIVEVGLQPVGGPALLDGPRAWAIAGCMRERETANATALADTHQNVTFHGHIRLHDRIALPWVFPEQCPAGERDAGRAG